MTEPLPLDEVTARLQAHIETLKRPAWKPLVEPIEDSDEPSLRTTSTFCGPPYLAPGEDWPRCECGQPLQLFLQLDLTALPGPLVGKHGGGLLQVFYHHLPLEKPDGGECYGEPGWEPFDESSKLVRVVHPGGEPQNDSFDPDANRNNKDEFPPLRIVGWTKVEDSPSYDETGIDVEYGFRGGRKSVACPAIGLQRDIGPGDKVDGASYESWLFEEQFDESGNLAGDAPLGRPHDGDKLGGWPAWVQGVEYPKCIECGEPMDMLFQIDSEDNVPYMFGDCGTAHVTQCPTHPDVVAMGWACG